MQVAIDGSVFGVQKYRLVDLETYESSWVNFIDDDTWAYGDKHASLSLETLAKLACIDLPEPPKKYRKSFESIGYRGSIPWVHALPSDVFASYLKDLMKSFLSLLNFGPTGYYRDVYLGSREFLQDLERACVDVSKLHHYILSETNESQVGYLKTCIPSRDGFAKRVQYDDTLTKTGRMKVVDGPAVLHLKRDYRDVFISSFKGGKIVSLDYTSLEARVALAIADNNVPRDVYTYIAEGYGMPREVAKIATLSLLFGANPDTIYKNLTISNGYEIKMSDFDTFYDHLYKMLNINKLISLLTDQYDTTEGYIKNYFGRTLKPSSNKTNILINNYIQSTGVDVCCLGMQAIVNEIGRLNLRMKPLFVIHDCIYLDVPPEELPKLEHLTGVGSRIPGFSTPFFISAKNNGED